VKAIGNHDFLMATSKEYAEMVLRQQLESELEGVISHA
jgi:ABC-type multidrug transport system fused ATPase/permease subunit